MLNFLLLLYYMQFCRPFHCFEGVAHEWGALILKLQYEMWKIENIVFFKILEVPQKIFIVKVCPLGRLSLNYSSSLKGIEFLTLKKFRCRPQRENKLWLWYVAVVKLRLCDYLKNKCNGYHPKYAKVTY